MSDRAITKRVKYRFFRTFCNAIQSALENPTPEVKQEILRLLVEEIVVGDDTVTIKHIIPVDDFSRLFPRGNMQKTPNSPVRGSALILTERLAYLSYPLILGFNESALPCRIGRHDWVCAW